MSLIEAIFCLSFHSISMLVETSIGCEQCILRGLNQRFVLIWAYHHKYPFALRCEASPSIPSRRKLLIADPKIPLRLPHVEEIGHEGWFAMPGCTTRNKFPSDYWVHQPAASDFAERFTDNSRCPRLRSRSCAELGPPDSRLKRPCVKISPSDYFPPSFQNCRVIG
jgi:hypothetical protein